MTIQLNKKFNITELIEYYHEEKIPLPDKFKSFDYTELTKKVVTFTHKGRDDRYDLNETIARNIIRELPLEAYKSCFSLDWFAKDHRDSRTIHAAFEGKRFDFLDHIINVVAALTPEPGKEREFNGDLRSQAINILIPITNCFTDVHFDHLDYKKKDIDALYPIWEKCVNVLENMQTQIWIGANKKKGKDILEQYANVQESSKDATYNLMKGLNKPMTLDVFKKIFSVISDKTKKSVFMEGEHPLSEDALYNGDKKTIEFLEQEKLITTQHYKNVMVEKYNIEYNSDKVTPVDIWFYKKAQEVISNEEKLKFPAEDVVGLVKRFQKNDVILNDVFQNYPQLGTDKIMKGCNLSLAEIDFALKVAEKIGYNHKDFISSLDSSDRHVVEITPLLLNKFPQSVNVSVASVMESAFTKKLINDIASKNNVSTKNATTSFLEEGIAMNLKPDSVDNKRIKI
jgi:hypothetical protein